MSNARVFLDVYDRVMGGNVLSPRGSKIVEVENVQFDLEMDDSPCTSFKARKFNLDYAKAEFVWYLRGNPFDTYIEQYASTWPKLKQPDGSYYSNYGQYLFGQYQLAWALNQLVQDKDTRRASCVLLSKDHLFNDNVDIVCTYGLNLRIRQNKLNMSVSMRSNDLVWGTTNDVFAFSMLYNIAYAYLKFTYPALKKGIYTHKVDSLHIYEKHWDMVKHIIQDGMAGYRYIDIPEISSFKEVNRLLNYHQGIDLVFNTHDTFSVWLFT